jgi:hypothetical protein
MKKAKHIVTEKSDLWNTVDDGLHLQRIFKRCGPSEGKEQLPQRTQRRAFNEKCKTHGHIEERFMEYL